jgi:hypothetical protein
MHILRITTIINIPRKYHIKAPEKPGAFSLKKKPAFAGFRIALPAVHTHGVRLA